jgi:predicted AlkP superfamily phosphohydrolase/phosphomutase
MLRRTLASACLASSLLAAEIVLLTLLLNPGVSLGRDGAGLLLALFLPYAVAGTLALLAFSGLLDLFRFWPRALRPPIEGLPSFTSFTLVALSAAAGLYWLNLRSFRDSIPLDAALALERAALSTSGAALIALGVGAAALLRPFRRRVLSAPLLVLAAGAGVVVPLALRPTPGPAPSPVPLSLEPVRPLRRVTLVGIDGLSPDFAREGALRGRLPALARMLRRGAHAPLATLSPTQAPPLWTTVVTGVLPRDHGVKSFSSYRLVGSATPFELLPRGIVVGALERAGLISRRQLTAAARRRRALWNALNAFGIQTGVVRLWGTHPAERVQGFMLSNYFHLLQRDKARLAASLFPPDLVQEAAARAVSPDGVDPALVAQFVDLSVEAAGDRLDWRTELLDKALAPDLTYERAGRVLRAAYDPPFFATYFYGLDVVGHAFLRYARPDEFGDVGEPQLRRYGRVVERYAAFLDERLGALAQEQHADEVLILISTHGMRPTPLWRTVLARLLGRDAPSGSHEGAPPGLLAMAGDGVRAGAVADGASLLDVAPTILYLMGLPVGRDMEGRILTELLDEAFTRAHPVTFIPSYESLAVSATAEPFEPGLPPLPEEP